MSLLGVKLNETNSQKLEALSHQTGKTPAALANEAMERFTAATEVQEKEKFARWRAAALRIEGMWKDRDDLPDFAELRKSWDRDVWSR
jgi:predicted DNA-binding protein